MAFCSILETWELPRTVVYGLLAFCEWFCCDVSQFGAHCLKTLISRSLGTNCLKFGQYVSQMQYATEIAYIMNSVLTLDYQLLLSIKSKN